MGDGDALFVIVKLEEFGAKYSLIYPSAWTIIRGERDKLAPQRLPEAKTAW